MSIRDFRFEERKEIDYSTLIETVLNKIEYRPNDDYKAFETYYMSFNPFIDDNKTMSAMFHTADGIMVMFNGAIEKKRSVMVGGEYKIKTITTTSLTPIEYCRELGLVKEYINFILSENGVPATLYNEYKRMLAMDDVEWQYRRGYNAFRAFMFHNFINDKDILEEGDVRAATLRTARKKRPMPKAKNNIVVEKADIRRVRKYTKDRKIQLSENVYSVNVHMGSYKKPGLCFRYPSGFMKIRFLEGKLRYMASNNDGKYTNLFECRVNNTKTCYVVEGEIEGLSMLGLIDDDVYSLHNVNSLPNDLTQLEKYDKIVVKLDNDKYEEVKAIFDKMKQGLSGEVVVSPKVMSNDKKIDYNSLLLANKLTKEIIEEV